MVEARESALILRSFDVHGAFHHLLCRTWCSSKLWMVLSGNLWSCLREVKPLVVVDWERGISLVPMQGNWASSQIDLGYMEHFCVAELNSGCLKYCHRVLGDSLEFHQGSQGSFHVSWRKRNCSACNAGESGLIFCRGGSLMVFLELRREPGIYF